MQICMLASGSKGNATVLQFGDQAIVIDCGLSGKEFSKRIALIGLDPAQIRAVVVSHEHSDHILGAGILSRKYKIPLYINQKTFAAAQKKLGKIEHLEFFDCGQPFAIDPFRLHPFSISHDSTDPAGFTISANGIKLGIATDLGIASLVVREHLRECNALILESNHDVAMLMANENYPWALKQRVKSRHGHLSNDDAAGLLSELSHPGLSHVILAHLSEENNLPEKVTGCISRLLPDTHICLTIASQHEPTAVISL